MPRTIRPLPLLSLVIVAACQATGPEVLHVGLDVSATVVSSSEPIDIRVVVRNVGAFPIDVAASGCPQVFDVLAVDGAVVGPEAPLCPLALIAPRRLAPGEELSFSYSWGGLARGGVPLQPGAYELRGWGTPLDGDPVSSERVLIEVE